MTSTHMPSHSRDIAAISVANVASVFVFLPSGIFGIPYCLNSKMTFPRRHSALTSPSPDGESSEGLADDELVEAKPPESVPWSGLFSGEEQSEFAPDCDFEEEEFPASLPGYSPTSPCEEEG